MEKSNAIEGEKLAAAIPREYMQPSVIRGLAGLAVSLALYAGSLAGIAWVHNWYLAAPFILIAGLGGWGLHCVGHDCGHGAFSRNRRLNFAIGHFVLLPLMYPFHAWRHEHNTHHAHTNNLELDVDWRPVSMEHVPTDATPVPARLLQHAVMGDLGRHHQLLGQIRFQALVLSQKSDAA